jgi:2-polyprenyl-6-methoxyphenol hydroxylase-like FAD-dependent oxidoreductase
MLKRHAFTLQLSWRFPSNMEEMVGARGRVAEEARRELLRRFDSNKLPCLKEMTSNTEDLFFYPVFTLPKHGLWFRGRVLLIGDASHAVRFLLFILNTILISP